VTVTTPASAFDYLTAVANGQTKAAGLKRPTVAALQQAAKALGLADRIDHAPYGYHVGTGWNVSPCSNLKAAASALLAALARAPYAAAPAPGSPCPWQLKGRDPAGRRRARAEFQAR
jgi:hypothetical protein